MTPLVDNSKKRIVLVAGKPPAVAHVSQERRRRRTSDGARLVLAAVLGALAAACSVGLLATAAWLISRSALRPQVLFLVVLQFAIAAAGNILGTIGNICQQLLQHLVQIRFRGD